MKLPLLALALASCCSKDRATAGEGGSAPAPGDPERKVVAFLLSTAQEERYQKDERYFEETARKKGLTTFILSADNDNARQLSQVEDALSRHPRVLVIQPTDSSASGSYVAKAHAQGAQVVAYDRSIPNADFYVAHDSYRVGVIQAEEALKATHGKGNYVLLNGQSGQSVATEIARGYHDTLDSHVRRGEVSIVVEKSHDAWSPEQALKTVEDAISKTRGNLDAILANNSGMARGGVQAVQAAGLGGRGIFIAGADADAANVNYVCEKKQTIEILKEIQPLAEEAATVAAALAEGHAVPAATKIDGVPAVSVPVVLVTSDNVKPLLLDSGFHSASALPRCR